MQRREICVQCERPLCTVKGKRYVMQGGHRCRKCYIKALNSHKSAQTATSSTQAASGMKRSASLLNSGSVTRAHADQLLSTIHAQHKRGKTRSAEDTARAILSVYHEASKPRVQRTLSFDGVVKGVAQEERMSSTVLRASIRRFVSEGTLQPPSPERLTRADPQHPLYLESGPPLRVQELLYRLVREAQEENHHCSLYSLRASLLRELDVEVPRSTLASWMHSLRIHWGTKKLTGATQESTNVDTQRFVREYAAAIAEEEAGEAVIVWMDESYIHVGISSSHGWFIEEACRKRGANRYRGQSKGQRFIIMHAMTRHGMLELRDTEPRSDLSIPCPSAMVVEPFLTVEGVSPEDYHDTVNSERFIAYFENRLTRAFKAKFPGKRMILLMDNAGYHHARGADWMTPADMSRGQLADALRQVDVKQISGLVRGKQRSFDASKFSADEKDGGPTLLLLREELSKWLASHDDANVEVPTQLVRDIAKGSRIIYTPPYESWLQPIEMVWAQVKQRVREQSDRLRKGPELQQQTKTALRAMSSERLQKIIRHVHDDIDDWLQTSDAGWLQAWKSLAALVASSPEQRNAAWKAFYIESSTEPAPAAAQAPSV
jgi:transposase